jgi:putative tricarboxylic transport membrane protein
MRVNDTVIGSVLLLLSIAVLWHVQGFPDMPGQPYGPAVFPGVAAAGLGLCSLLLIVQGVRSGAPLVQREPGPSRSVLPLATTIGGLFFYYFLVERLGFVVCAPIVLAALLWTFGVRRALIAPVALVSTLVIHTAFYKLLKVPLPWGVMQRFAW